MRIEEFDSVLIIDKTTRKWINEFELYEEDEKTITAAKEYLEEPDKYEVVFRKSTFVIGATLREAYDLAKAHPDDNYIHNTEAMYPGEMTCGTADGFMQQIKEDFEIITEEFDYSDDKGWNEEAKEFLWARRMSADGERAIREEYNL